VSENAVRGEIGAPAETPAATTPEVATTTDEVTPAAPPRRGLAAWTRKIARAGRSARTKILLSYVAILAVCAVLAVGLLREALIIRDADRVEDSLEQEMQELDRLLVGTDPETGQPFASLEALFDVYLRRNVPSEDEAILTFIDGQFYRSAMSQYPLDTLPSETLAGWEEISTFDPVDPESATGRFESPIGGGYFRLARVRIGDHTGAFVVASVPADDLVEIDQLQALAIVVAGAALMIGSAAAWIVTSRVLAPVRSLTETAESISRSDLTRRIEVTGGGEAGDMARSFNAMLDRLEGVFRSQREFVQDTSHELRAPLTICRGTLEMLPEDREERDASIALVVDEIDRMARIVNELQVLADAEHPDFVRPETIDLEPFTHELVAKAGALAPRRWTLDVSADGDAVADRWGLTEAVMNLANNAAANTDPDDTIAIGSSVEDGTLRLWVRDTGVGIPLADQARIFERFQRGTGAQRRYRGSGLGLAIVKAITEAHGGRVELVSHVGSGSTFTLIIPMHPASAA
jgi:two-component system, OmpR family, sensor kinase